MIYMGVDVRERIHAMKAVNPRFGGMVDNSEAELIALVIIILLQ